MNLVFACLILLVFCFTYVNGFRDGCNVVATLIASRAMEPKPALIFASAVELVSPFAVLLIGSSVSGTIRKLVDESAYIAPDAQGTGLIFIITGIVAAIAWNMVTWKFAIPSSSSHALIGGIVGAGLAAFGVRAIAWGYFWLKVVLMIFLTPMLSFLVGLGVMKLILSAAKHLSASANKPLRYAQYINMIFLAFNHSFNDSQKSTGILMILLGICFGSIPAAVPLWAIALSAFALALGILTGGFKVIKTVGSDIYRIRPIHSFASQLASSLVILGASLIGAPVSASQIVSSSIMGVGSAERIRAVKWKTAGKIFVSWLVTIPVAGSVGALLFLLLHTIFI